MIINREVCKRRHFLPSQSAKMLANWTRLFQSISGGKNRFHHEKWPKPSFLMCLLVIETCPILRGKLAMKVIQSHTQPGNTTFWQLNLVNWLGKETKIRYERQTKPALLTCPISQNSDHLGMTMTLWRKVGRSIRWALWSPPPREYLR